MTFLRNMGLAHKLPLDHSIYFHKVVGWLIFGQAWLHTIAHLINFGKCFVKLVICLYLDIGVNGLNAWTELDWMWHSLIDHPTIIFKVLLPLVNLFFVHYKENGKSCPYKLIPKLFLPCTFTILFLKPLNKLRVCWFIEDNVPNQR